MFNRHAVVSLVFSLWFVSAAAHGQNSTASRPAPLERYLPKETIACVDVPRPGELLHSAASGALFSNLQQLPEYKKAMKEGEGLKLLAGLAAFRVAAGVDFMDAIDKVSGRGFVAALLPPGEKQGWFRFPEVLMIARGDGHDSIINIRNSLATFAGLRADGEWVADKVKIVPQVFQKLGAVEIVKSDKTGCFAVAGDVTVITSSLPLMLETLSRIEKGGESLADSIHFAPAAFLLEGSDAFAWLDVDKYAADVNDEFKKKERKLEPAAALLFGGIQQSLVDSKWLAASLHFTDRALSMRVLTSALPGIARETFLPEIVSTANVHVPRYAGSLTMRRDINAFWKDHEGLVAGELDAEFAKFNSTAGTIFGVKRMDEDVFPKLSPIAQFVFARQTFGELAAAPKIKLPAIAMVLQARGADAKENIKIGDGFRRAFQTAVALSAADAAQKGRPALGLNEESVGRVKLTYATFPEPTENEGEAIYYNFSPAFFSYGKHIAIASTRELAKDLIATLDASKPDASKPDASKPDASKPDASKPDASKPDASKPYASSALDGLDAAGRDISEMLAQNADAIIANEVLEKGKDKKTAERELRTFVELLSLISNVKFEITAAADGFDGALEIEWNSAPTAAGGPASRPARVDR
ncbi:MAG: hypothetical protein HY286_07125 [Planctomycetes bacterium]|nr:hypothetical protein [Planctomycetota bacterium]